MKFDITWSITAIIAVSSFLSPIVVSIINNKHQYAMRKLELNANLADKQLISLYNQKIDAYKSLLVLLVNIVCITLVPEAQNRILP